MKNRSRSEIYRSILETANADEGTNKTKLMYKSYLSFNQLKEYLATLQENSLIRIRSRNAALQNNRERHTGIAAAK